MARTVYLTCELKSRDLDSRLLLAAHLVKSGMDVVVGQQWSMFGNMASCPKGVFLYKTANRLQVESMSRARAAGHIVLAMDEEVLVLTDKLSIELPNDARVFDVAHVFMFQNEHHRAMFGRSGPIVGNTRVDLLRTMRDLYEPDVAACRAPGPYVLINTNFTLENTIWRDPNRALQVALAVWQPDMNDPVVRQYITSWIETEKANAAAMKAFLKLLGSNSAGRRIVVRPHPAENAETWTSVEGIEIVRGSNPLPWIMGADISVHTNSTTGLEAALLDCACLNLNPARGSIFSRTMCTNNADLQASTAEEALDIVMRAVGGEKMGGDKSWIPDLREDAAAAVSAEILKNAIDSPALSSWQRFERADVEAEKFTATVQEVGDRFSSIAAHVGVKKVGLQQLDDSLFYFSPAAAS